LGSDCSIFLIWLESCFKSALNAAELPEKRRIKMATESTIKHTTAGEMPNVSKIAQLERRMNADLSLLSDPVILRRLALGLGVVVLALGVGLYFSRRI
jgi:hypothetical protein